MSDVNAGGEGPLSAREAASMLSAEPVKKAPEFAEDDAPDAVEPFEADDLPQGKEAAPDDDQTSGEDEDQGSDDPDSADAEPPIDPPRSWTKEDKELFKSLPRESQHRLLEIDRARELEVRRGQNEAAELRKAAEAEQRALAEARQQYEAALPNVLNQFTDSFNAKFSDIKTWDDVAKMRNDDPLRFMEWQTEREKGAALQQQAQQAQARQAQEWKQNFEAWTVTQDQEFAKIAPEFFDPKTATQSQQQAIDLMESVGFTRDEIRAGWEGKTSFSLRDHRFQTVIRDAMRYRSAKAAVKTAPVKAAPPVQRPGAAPAKGEAKLAQVQELETKLKRGGSVKDAVALLRARRA